MMKPGTGDEATGKSSRRAPRGERGQRAWKDRLRNLGGPQGHKQPRGINNFGWSLLGVGQAHSSREAGNDRGAKGSEQRHAYGREGESRLDENPTTEEL